MLSAAIYIHSQSAITPYINGKIYTDVSGDVVLYCGRIPAANAHGCTAAEGLLYKPWSLVVPTYTDRCLHQRP